MIHMDLTISQRSNKEGRALVPAANKSDLSGAGGNFEMHRIRTSCRNHLHKCAVPVVNMCASGSRIKKLVLEVLTVYDRWELCVEVRRFMYVSSVCSCGRSMHLVKSRLPCDLLLDLFILLLS